jgi:hypothetical protein
VDACERYLNAIQELVDGTLGPIRRAELELHLEACDGCRALAADLQEIARTARSLDVLQPPGHLWKSIAGQLRAERATAEPSRTLGSHRSVALLAIAAALVLAVGASLFMLRGPATAPQTATTSQGVGQPAPGNAASENPVQNVETALTSTETEFKRLVDATNAVDPTTAAALQKPLLVMNEAMNEARKALDADPQSAPARASFYEVLRQKIQFLQETIALMNEMRQGDAAGAAELVESGKS